MCPDTPSQVSLVARSGVDRGVPSGFALPRFGYVAPDARERRNRRAFAVSVWRAVRGSRLLGGGLLVASVLAVASGVHWSWKADFDGDAAVWSWFGGELGVVGGGDCLDDGESESVAVATGVLGAGAVESLEGLE